MPDVSTDVVHVLAQVVFTELVVEHNVLVDVITVIETVSHSVDVDEYVDDSQKVVLDVDDFIEVSQNVVLDVEE